MIASARPKPDGHIRMRMRRLKRILFSLLSFSECDRERGAEDESDQLGLVHLSSPPGCAPGCGGQTRFAIAFQVPGAPATVQIHPAGAPAAGALFHTMSPICAAAAVALVGAAAM